MSKNILDLRRVGRKSAQSCEGYAERLSLCSYSALGGQELQLTLGGYPYSFIELNRKSVQKLRDKLTHWLEDNK